MIIPRGNPRRVRHAIRAVHATAWLALLAGNASALPPPLDPQIVSRNGSGTLTGAIKGSISGDGRYVAFTANLAGNGVLRRDRVTGDVLRIDQIGGVPGNALSFHPQLSEDGTRVAFESFATNFTAGDANANVDIYVATLSESGAHVFERASVGTDGNDLPGMLGCYEPDLDRAAGFVVFACERGDGAKIVYRRDLVGDVTIEISINQVGGISNGARSEYPAISPNGNYVAFVSDATDLVASDTNAKVDAFVRDVGGSFTVRVSTTSTFAQIVDGFDGVGRVDVGDGCHFAFDHDGNGIVASDTDDAYDVFHGVCANYVDISSQASGGTSGAGESRFPSLVVAPDAFFVAFESNDDLDTSTPDPTTGSDVYVRSPFDGLTRRINLPSVEGENFDSFAVGPRLSADGRQVSYQAAGASISDQRVAVRNPLAKLLPEESVDVTAFGFADSLAGSLSGDGSKVVFMSDSGGFDRGWTGLDADAQRDIFVYDMATGCVEQASMGDGATNGGDCVPLKQWQATRKGSCGAPQICGPTLEPAIDAAGTRVVFVTDDAAVAKYANEDDAERATRRAKGTGFAIAMRNLITNQTFRLATATSTGTGSQPRVAPGGASVVFVSGAQLAGADGNAQNDVYRLTLQASGAPSGAPECLSCSDENGQPVPAGGSAEPTLSGDGTKIAFSLPNVVGGRDLLIRNLVTGSAQRVASTATAAARSNAKPAFDYGGKRLVFQSDAALGAGEPDDGVDDVFLLDLQAGGGIVRASGGNGASRDPAISGDGKVLSYVTTSTDLDPQEDALDGEQYVHVRSVSTGGPRTTLARNRRGGLIGGPSRRPALDYNGTRVVSDTAAADVLGEGGDTNGALDVFVRAVPFNIDRIYEDGFE